MKVRRSETQIVRIVEEFMCVLKHRRFYVRWNDEVGGIFQSKKRVPPSANVVPGPSALEGSVELFVYHQMPVRQVILSGAQTVHQIHSRQIQGPLNVQLNLTRILTGA
jgi:hypothetical protein